MLVLCVCQVSVDTFFSFSCFIVAISWTSVQNFTVNFSLFQVVLSLYRGLAFINLQLIFCFRFYYSYTMDITSQSIFCFRFYCRYTVAQERIRQRQLKKALQDKVSTEGLKDQLQDVQQCRSCAQAFTYIYRGKGTSGGEYLIIWGNTLLTIVVLVTG